MREEEKGGFSEIYIAADEAEEMVEVIELDELGGNAEANVEVGVALPPPQPVREHAREEEDVQILNEAENNCEICYTIRRLFSARCGHKACSGCWEKWLSSQEKCPFCRMPVRRSNLFAVQDLTQPLFLHFELDAVQRLY